VFTGVLGKGWSGRVGKCVLLRRQACCVSVPSALWAGLPTSRTIVTTHGGSRAGPSAQLAKHAIKRNNFRLHFLFYFKRYVDLIC